MEVLTFAHSTVARRGKSRPRIENTSQNPKILPRIQARPRIQKHFPEFNNVSKNPTHVPGIQKHFWIPESVFGLWEIFWIL